MRSSILLLPCCFALASCQVLLGFEDKQLAEGGGGGAGASGAGGSGAGASGGGGAGASGSGGSGGGEDAFESPELVASHTDALHELVVDSSAVFALSRTSGEVLRFEGGPPRVLTNELLEPRGLAADAANLYLTGSAVGEAGSAVARLPKAGGARVIVTARMGTRGVNEFRDVAVGGGELVTSLDDGVRRTSSGAMGGAGTTIGTAVGAGPLGTVALGGGSYFWIDPDASGGRVHRSDGGSANGPPPGNQVEVVVTTPGPTDLALDGDELFVISSEGLGTVSASANDGTLEVLVADAVGGGLSVDATHVYWVDGTRVRAVPRGGGQPVLLYTGGNGTPFDTAATGDAVYFTTSDGDVVRVAKTAN